MSRLADKLAAGGLLWISAEAYAARLLANGQAPLLDVAEYVAWHRKAQGLLKSGVASVDIGAIAEAWIGRDAALREAMAAKRRATVPLKTLLADENLRQHLRGILQGLRACHPDLPLVLEIPSPRRWLIAAYTLAHGEAPESDGDAIDGAAVYVADFLRSFGESGVDALLLSESADDEPASAEEVEWYQAVFNVAAHYRWDAGLQLPGAAQYNGGNAGLQFLISPRAIAGASTGIAVPAAFWTDGDAATLANGSFRFVEVPADAVPEQVLARLASLR